MNSRKEYLKTYKQTPSAKEADKKYHKTSKYKVWRKIFNTTKKRKDYMKKYQDKLTESRKSIKQELVLYKGGKCQICGLVDDCYPVYDFHHIEGNKEFGITSGIIKHYSFDKLKQEVDKCILVCSNCHRKIHFK